MLITKTTASIVMDVRVPGAQGLACTTAVHNENEKIERLIDNSGKTLPHWWSATSKTPRVMFRCDQMETDEIDNL